MVDITSEEEKETKTEEISEEVTSPEAQSGEEVAKEEAVREETQEKAAPEETDQEETPVTDGETPSNASEKSVETAPENKQKVDISPKAIGILAGAVLIVAAIFLIVLLLPANRLKRYTVGGNRAFETQDYEKALKLYEKALNLNEYEYTALKGAILSAAASGDTQKRDDLAHQAVYAISDRETEITEEEMTPAIELILTAYEFLTDYSKDGATLWPKLQAAYSALSEPGELRPMLSEYAFNYGRTLEREDADPVDCLSLYGEAFDYAGGSEPVAETAGQTVTRLAEVFVAADDFDKARETLETYSQFSFDKEGLNEKIDNAENLYETKISFMTRVYENLAVPFTQSKDAFHEGLENETEGVDFGLLSYDWFEMQNLDGSEAADLLSLAYDGEPVIYSPEGYSPEKEMVACGLYPYGGAFTNADGKLTTSYYFFMGNYVNGKREGYGISFIRVGETSFHVSEGYWKDDKPNGYGVLYRKNNYSHTQLPEYTDVLFGNYVDGIQDGTIVARIVANEYPGVVFQGTYEVKDGYGVEVPDKTGDYELLDPIPEGYVLIAVIPSVADGYSNYMIYRDPVGEKKGTIGYN